MNGGAAMSDVNYPDVLGAITGGVRGAFDVLQAAVAVRPSLPLAGHPFELALIVQNASDERVELGVVLTLPETDAARQRDVFSCEQPRARLLLQPAEAGLLILPVLTRIETAPAQDYRARLALEVRPAAKPRRLRHAQGGGAFDPADLPAASLPWFDALKPLDYHAGKAHGHHFELTFGLAASREPPATLDRQTRYYSLWRVTTAAQPGPLLHLSTPLLRSQVLSQLKRQTTLAPLTNATLTRFESAGYPLHEGEAILIAKVMSLLLEYASPDDTHHGYIAAGRWAVTPLLGRALDMGSTLDIPRWLRRLLRLIEQEPRVAAHVPAALAGPAYFDLIYDAALHGFDLVEAATGEDVGSAEERNAFAGGLVDALQDGSMDFSRAYLPLIMGGILINEYLLMPQERPADRLHDLAAAIEQREPAITPDERPLLDMTYTLLDRTAQKYGFRVLP